MKETGNKKTQKKATAKAPVKQTAAKATAKAPVKQTAAKTTAKTPAKQKTTAKAAETNGKIIIVLSCAIALIVLISTLLGVFLHDCSKIKDELYDKENEVIETEDSRIFKYAEHVGTISNPGVGYTSTDWYYTSLGGTKVHDKQGAVVLFFIDIGPFSSGINDTGIDYDLDEQFFTALRGTFENCRKNGSTIALRFRYDSNGKGNPEPATFDYVLKHIKQVKESKVLEDYKDILMFVESGFVGQWGEQHGGKYTTVEYKARVLEAMLDCVPSPVPVTVRTPDIFAKYVGISRGELADYVVEEGTDAARVGLFDDGYMGSNSDLGTYSNREIETTWLGGQTLTSYFGGEFSGNIEFAKKYDTYLPENCIPEMYKTHLSYINGNIFQLYKDYKFSAKYDVEGYDNSAYYGQTVFQFIRDHLGYRFVLNESNFPKSVAKGSNLEFSFKVTNNGFANPIKKQKCEIILEKDGNFVNTEVELDPTKWYSGETQNIELDLKLPALVGEGKWNVYFKSSIAVNNFSDYGFRSIRFASKDVWHSTLGANYLGYVEITSSSATDNSFGEEGKTQNIVHLYNLGNKVVVDGFNGEWTEEDIIAKDEQHKLYAKCDEENLYIMADIPHKAKSPVFNFKAKRSDGTSYWLYQAANGFVYFNHDGAGHVGMLMKYSDNLFEFKIPFYMLGLQKGTVLTEISVNIQDSGNDWKSTGSLKTGESYTINPDFTVFNACESVTVKAGDNYEVELLADADISQIVWYLDGEEITDEKSARIKLENIQEDCSLSAKIISSNGTEKEINIAEIKVN